MSDKAYDEYKGRFVLPLGTTSAGVPITGTANSLTLIAGTASVVPFACKLIKGARYVTTGATSTSPTVLANVIKMAQGTGTATAVGTFSYNGTQASAGATGTMAYVASGTAANFAAGDLVGMSLALQTTAAAHTQFFTVGFEELFE